MTATGHTQHCFVASLKTTSSCCFEAFCECSCNASNSALRLCLELWQVFDVPYMQTRTCQASETPNTRCELIQTVEHKFPGVHSIPCHGLSCTVRRLRSLAALLSTLRLQEATLASSRAPEHQQQPWLGLSPLLICTSTHLLLLHPPSCPVSAVRCAFPRDPSSAHLCRKGSGLYDLVLQFLGVLWLASFGSPASKIPASGRASSKELGFYLRWRVHQAPSTWALQLTLPTLFRVLLSIIREAALSRTECGTFSCAPWEHYRTHACFQCIAC